MMYVPSMEHMYTSRQPGDASRVCHCWGSRWLRRAASFLAGVGLRGKPVGQHGHVGCRRLPCASRRLSRRAPTRMPLDRQRQVRPVAWDGTELCQGRRQPGFALYPLPWPLDLQAACRLVFRTPLRILYNDRLIVAPTLAQLVVAALRRVSVFLPDEMAKQLDASHAVWRQLAEGVPSTPWSGQRSVLVRYSGTQGREISLRCISGGLDLPTGPGPLAPLLAAAWWRHLGKATVMGLGRMDIDVPDRQCATARIGPRL